MIFVTGGGGYIGSHTCVELIEAGFDVTVFDNFCNSSKEVLDRVQKITGREITIITGDIRNKEILVTAIKASNPKAVLHFAALKIMNESIEKPLDYYDNNFLGTVTLLRAMDECNIKNLIFSSSASVYGSPEFLPITEKHPLAATNPYARTKQMTEEMLYDLIQADSCWRIGILRYFNPVGGHQSGLIGENIKDTPTNIMPYISQVAIGLREYLNIWGDDYSTHDGTGVRDYIHVVDLAVGHLKALEHILKYSNSFTVNLGTGTGYSVLDLVTAFETVSGKAVPIRFGLRRLGDVASCYADVTLAKYLLGWSAKHDIYQMCEDAWRWQINKLQLPNI
jgi:UDP-glucose 4-epimerase